MASTIMLKMAGESGSPWVTPCSAQNGATVVSGGAADKDGLVPKGADEAEGLGSNPSILEDLEASTPVHGVERLAEIQKDAVEG